MRRWPAIIGIALAMSAGVAALEWPLFRYQPDLAQETLLPLFPVLLIPAANIILGYTVEWWDWVTAVIYAALSAAVATIGLAIAFADAHSLHEMGVGMGLLFGLFFGPYGTIRLLIGLVGFLRRNQWI